MVKVKTFMSALKIFHTKEELTDLDKEINEFIEKSNVKKVISVSDACTTDKDGGTIGIVRVFTYEQ